MNYLSLIEYLEVSKLDLKKAHQQAISNQLSSEEKDEAFESAHKKICSIIAGVYKEVSFEPSEAEYERPHLIHPNKNVNNGSVANQISALLGNLTKIQEELKLKKYSLVDKSTNKFMTLNNPTKSVYTKALKDLKALIVVFSTEK